MDLETENRIAAILMKEAAELRRQADKEGVHAYLRQPNTRFRPNSRFLTATVLGVQQANRAVEVNEMWSVRQKEQELDDRLKARARDESRSDRRGSNDSERSTSKRPAYAEPRDGISGSGGCSSSKRTIQNCYSREDESFKDDDIDEFLHSRVKRGRGAVGTRMDEPGPYLPTSLEPTEHQSTDTERWGRHVVLGPEKPRCLKSSEYDEDFLKYKKKKADKVSSSKRHSTKSKSKEKLKDKKKKKRKDERRSKRRTL